MRYNRLNENDLNRIVTKVLNEEGSGMGLKGVSACSKQSLFKVLNALKDPRRMITLVVDKQNQEYMIFKDESGEGCAAKRTDLFK